MRQKKKRKVTIGNPIIFFLTVAIVIFGSLMIASAEMGNAVGDTKYLSSVILKQIGFAIVGLGAFLFCTNFKNITNVRMSVYLIGYAFILFLLVITRAFGETNGAYAWIYLGPISIQPSEFAKAFMIVFGAKLLSKDSSTNNIKNLKMFALCSIIYVIVILLWQHDLGSAAVLFIICYAIAFIPPYNEYRKIQKYMFFGIFGAIAILLILMSDPVTNFLMNHSDDYRIGRFLAAANPFLYQYDYGYHLIMSLASFVTGGLFGLGYGNSIHKYMNFPNPSSDFILPVIVEEIGIVGFTIFVIAYFIILVLLVVNSFRCEKYSSKMIIMGTFIYFTTHFILNVGGVSGLIPLTGVPLLLISSGGSSLVFSLVSLGFAQSEIVRSMNESHSG